MDQSQVLGALSCKPESFNAPWAVVEQFILTRKAVEAAMLFLRQRY